MTQPKVQQLYNLLRSNTWVPSKELLEVIRRDLSGVTQTKLIEDGVRQERVLETHRGFHKSVSGEHCWEELIDARPESLRHRFKSLPYATELIPAGYKRKTVSPLFEVHLSEAPSAFRSIVSIKQAAPYFSESPASASRTAEDIGLLDYLVEMGNLDHAPKAWLCELAKDGRVVLSHPLFHKGRAFFARSLGGGTCLSGMPVEEAQVGKSETFYQLKDLTSFMWLPLLNPAEWQAQEVRWVTPWYLRLRTGTWPPAPGLYMLKATEKKSVLQTAALAGI